jgi:hypothetical protein
MQVCGRLGKRRCAPPCPFGASLLRRETGSAPRRFPLGYAPVVSRGLASNTEGDRILLSLSYNCR